MFIEITVENSAAAFSLSFSVAWVYPPIYNCYLKKKETMNEGKRGGRKEGRTKTKKREKRKEKESTRIDAKHEFHALAPVSSDALLQYCLHLCI